MSTIVVGIDGSECAMKALRFAAEEAELRHATLRAVCAWEVPPIVINTAGYGPIDESVVTAFRDDARRAVDASVAEVRWKHPTETVEGHVVRGQPAKALLDQSRDASLVVVGSRGRGGFSTLLLGSVSQETVHHAHCPVVVIRG